MEAFTIKSRLTTKEYRKVIFTGLYKKPVFILTTIVGFYLTATAILCYLHVIDYYTYSPRADILFGIFLLAAPTLIVLLAVSQFKSNPSFQNDMTFTFSEDGVAIEGLTFKSEFLWSHIIKQKELGKFLILYHNKKFGNFIAKEKLTSEQLNFIKSRVRK